MIVADASIAIAWSFEDERTELVDSVFDIAVRDGILVPTVWPLEIANTMRTAIRRGRITSEFRAATLADFGALRIEIDPLTSEYAWSSILDLSDKYDLTPYDAAYLELAVRRRLPLATIDVRLAAAARAAGVSVLP